MLSYLSWSCEWDHVAHWDTTHSHSSYNAMHVFRYLYYIPCISSQPSSCSLSVTHTILLLLYFIVCFIFNIKIKYICGARFICSMEISAWFCRIVPLVITKMFEAWLVVAHVKLASLFRSRNTVLFCGPWMMAALRKLFLYNTQYHWP